MKAVTIATMLLVMGAALANTGPVKLPNRTPIHADIKIGKNIGDGASERERNYFQAQELPFNSGDFRCQLRPVLFSGTRLAQLCR